MPWKANQQQFENPPIGSHIGRCYGLIELGTQQHVSEQFGARSKFDVRLSFELPNTKMLGKYNPEVKGQCFSVHTIVTRSLDKKSRLRPLLVGWRGREFTDEELKGFDEKKLIGVPCRIALIQNGEYVNIASLSPLSEGEKCPKQVNKSVYVSLDPQLFEAKMLEGLHESTAKKITASPEYQALMGGEQQPDPQDGPPSENEEAAGDDVPF